MLQVAAWLASAAGVIIAALYNIVSLRTANRTRQAQLFMQIYQDLSSTETTRKLLDILNMEWKDYDEFERKYGSDTNPDFAATRFSYTQKLNGVGWLLKQKLVDKESIYQLCGNWAIWVYCKFKPIIEEQTRRYKNPQAYLWLEHCGKEMMKIREQRGEPAEAPKTFIKYVKE